MGLAELVATERTCGCVDEYEGEYVETVFLCALRLPLVPRRSLWIMEAGGKRVGFPIRLHLRSVIAAYLRAWVVPAGVAVLAAWPSLGGVLVATALFAAFGRSWTWWPRDPDALWHIDFDLAAFGTRCDPARMAPAMRARLAEDLARRRAGDLAIRPLDQVMTHGPRTAEEALVTYGELRLGEGVAPSALRTRADVVEQAMKNVGRQRRVGDPFRDRFVERDQARIWDEIAEIAARRVHDRGGAHRAVPLPAYPAPAWLRSPQTWLGVLVASTLMTVGLAAMTLSHAPGHLVLAMRDVFMMAAGLATVAGWLAWFRLRRLRRHTSWIASF